MYAIRSYYARRAIRPGGIGTVRLGILIKGHLVGSDEDHAVGLAVFEADAERLLAILGAQAPALAVELV